MLETKKYVLTVEGETEQWYFIWLRDQINGFEGRKYNVSIVPKVQQSPMSFYKGTNSKVTPEVIHICDVESTDDDHIEKFENILKEMKEADRQKKIKYQLGYSNFTFELWMILHKKDCFGPFNSRKQYLAPIQQAFGEKFEDLDHYKQESAFKRCLEKLSLNDVKDALRRADKIAEQNVKDRKKLVNLCGYSYYRNNPALSINEVLKKIFTECGVLPKRK